MKHLFKSERLGFRNYHLEDLEAMHHVSGDQDVMEHFPAVSTKEQTLEFIQRMIKHYEKYQFCYFAVDRLDTMEMIGFIGLCTQDYLESIGKFVDVGWRLNKTSWGNGFATEGAKACLKFAFDELKLETVYAVATASNTKSFKVMKKIGMVPVLEFEHPKLKDYPRLVNCILYRINKK